MEAYAVIGLGLFGSMVARQLHANGENVIAIDADPAKVEAMADHVTRAVTADAKNRDVLDRLGVHKCKCAIVAMAGDLATSVLVTMNLKAIGVPEIICKARTSTDKEILETLGATTVIIPEHVAAHKLYHKLVSPNVLEYIELSSDYSIIEMKAPSDWCSRSIRDINVRAKYGVNIIALRRENETSIALNPEKVIGEDDVLVILGDNDSLAKVQELE